uniref:Variant surface glycoprotein 1125.1541 n=1 Tax=Trypanosoma brucei TaxID=5691 RepID=A0A1J0R7D4_9TRYP|nr:variant surface glycoprotein 1125.1541 [Trypanosoma brucei]
MMITSCVFLAVFFGTWAFADAQLGHPEDSINNLATDFCTLDIYHEALQNELRGWLTTYTSRASELAQEAKKLKLAEAAYRGKEKGPAYFVLSTIATEQAAVAAEQASKLIAAAAPALQILAKRQAELAVLASLASAPKAAPSSHAVAATGRTILKTSGSNNRICKAEIQPATIYKTDCSAAARHKPKLQAIGSHILKLKKLKTVKSADIKQPKLTVTTEAEGTLSNANNWEATSDKKGCEQHSSSATTAVLATNAIAVAAVEFEATSTAQELTLAEASAGDEAPDQKVSGN